jgi:hypothetical protein
MCVAPPGWLCPFFLFGAIGTAVAAFPPVRLPTRAPATKGLLLFSLHNPKAHDDHATTALSFPPKLAAASLANKKSLPFTEAKELWSQEWHDSFVRNDLADFVPPLTSFLNCLLIGGDDDDDDGLDGGGGSSSSSSHMPHSRLEGTAQAHANELLKNDTSSIRYAGQATKAAAVVVPKENSDRAEEISSLLFGESSRPTSDLLIPHLSEPVSPPSDFDCILDRGLMDELVAIARSSSSGSSFVSMDAVGQLFLEATRRIKEHGVYVVVTKNGMLSADVQDYLVSAGELLGMEWKFDLDGISDDETSVSVARKYFSDELPTVGRLARAGQGPRHEQET